MKKLLIAFLIGSLSLAPISVRADEKDDRIAELEAKVSELEERLAKYEASSEQESYGIGETWTVAGLWSITIDGVEETSDRNPYSDQNPEAVYIINYTYENLGYENDFLEGLFISMEEGIVDAEGSMGYSYPADTSKYPQPTPVGAKCTAQSAIGVDHPGSFTIHYSNYDSEGNKYKTLFEVELD